MRFLQKTDYAQDVRLFRYGRGRSMWVGLALFALLLLLVVSLFGDVATPVSYFSFAIAFAIPFAAFLGRRDKAGEGGGAALWYGLLGIAVLTAPHVTGIYFLSQLNFVLTYAIAGVGLMILLGFAGQISLGHAAFMACGAYTAAILQAQGFDILVSFPAAMLLSAALGVVIGLPALRMTGIYLAFATFAFAFIVEEVLARWESVTGGNLGILVDAPSISLFGWSFVFDDEIKMYYLALGLFVPVLLLGLNIQRSATGRAFMAIRDSETAAQALGVNLAVYKTLAFAISAAMTGLAGALYGHMLFFISPEGFTILLSINLLVMLIVGGLGSMHGAVFGAMFLVVLPQAIAMLRDYLPDSVAQQSGLETGIFGLIIILTIVFEPQGIYGQWVKIRTYFNLFPLYRKGSFKRQKSYMASERNR